MIIYYWVRADLGSNLSEQYLFTSPHYKTSISTLTEDLTNLYSNIQERVIEWMKENLSEELEFTNLVKESDSSYYFEIKISRSGRIIWWGRITLED